MSDTADPDTMPQGEDTAAAEEHRKPVWRRVLGWIGWAVLGLLALILLFIAFLHTGPGRQFIVDQISAYSPASGLSVEVESIDGSVLWSATFNDVRLYDATDTLFLEVPAIDLNWRPHKFLWSGLDVRHLVIEDGTLYKMPELESGDPDAPTLPNFDIRVDRFVINDLTVAEGVLGEERVVDFGAQVDIREGLVYLDAEGELGGDDVFTALVHAEPDGDRFDLDVDWRGPEGGFLAAMVGAEEELNIRLQGDGTWTRWDGTLNVDQGGEPLVDMALAARQGEYGLVGEVRPGGYVEGLTAEALGEVVEIEAQGTLVDSVLDGGFSIVGAAVDARGQGAIDLGNNAVEDFALEASLLDPALFGEGFVLDDTRLTATLDGQFSDLDIAHELRVGEANAGGTILRGLVQQGVAEYDGSRAVLPLNVSVERVVSGVEMIDPRLVNGSLNGTLVYTGQQLLADNLALRFPGLRADLGLQGNLDSGVYSLSGPILVAGFELENVGSLNTRANIDFRYGPERWRLNADVDGQLARVTNETLTTIAGDDIAFSGGVSLSNGLPISFDNAQVNGTKLQLTVDGQVAEGATTLAGSGEHTEYGPFTIDASYTDAGPAAELVFADPLPAAGLTDVRVAVAPTEEGFAIETDGGSSFGPFDGLINLALPEDEPIQIGVERFDLAQTRFSGDLALGDGGVVGTLDVAGGGLDGAIDLATRQGGQAFDVALDANDAQFGDALSVSSANVDASGYFGDAGLSVEGDIDARGLSYNNFFLARLAARGQYEDGTGSFDAALAGGRGSRFDLKLTGQIAPERIAVAAEGSFGDNEITMPRRAVLTQTQDGGWQLRRTQLGYGDGYAIAEGRFGGEQPAQGRVSLSSLPLSIANIATGELGLGGTVSGVVDFSGTPEGIPTGEARLQIRNLTRSGLVLTSRPLDVALVADLSPELMQARAVMQEGGDTLGRLQARIANMPAGAGLTERLYNGDLFAQLRYDGPAASLWRLSGLELLDLTGPLRVAAAVRGSLGDPQVQGTLAADDLRVQSGLTGSDVSGVTARGRFNGSRLQLTRFSGTAPNGGSVSGSGFVDLSGMTAERGPRIDLRIAARDAQILDLQNMGATVTGPLRIVSDGRGGTVAGRLDVEEARWVLGASEAVQDLPSIEVTEVNLPDDRTPPAPTSAPWRYLIDVSADGGIGVTGMGLDSEWRGDIELRGTTDEPILGGGVSIVPRQGFYSFAGQRFEITRGEIQFDRNVPIDPRVDILAETDVNGLSVDVNVDGTASQPMITFSSTPALPEEELLAQLLFGGSVTDLSATDAIQLGAALASLRGGGGMGPINRLRNAIGLDRLRIVGPDPALDRGTAVALGKNITDEIYAEIITDGQSYNATEVEYRVTSWLSLLATINTIGRYSAGAQYSKDY